MVLDTFLLNTQHYKVWIKGKVEQLRERRSNFLYTFGVVAIEKGAFRSPLITVANFTFTYIYIYICKCTNMKKQSIQRMILIIVELIANVNVLVFSLNYHQGI